MEETEDIVFYLGKYVQPPLTNTALAIARARYNCQKFLSPPSYSER